MLNILLLIQRTTHDVNFNLTISLLLVQAICKNNCVSLVYIYRTRKSNLSLYPYGQRNQEMYHRRFKYSVVVYCTVRASVRLTA